MKPPPDSITARELAARIALACCQEPGWCDPFTLAAVGRRRYWSHALGAPMNTAFLAKQDAFSPDTVYFSPKLAAWWMATYERAAVREVAGAMRAMK
jgi:hypothetical protein